MHPCMRVNGNADVPILANNLLMKQLPSRTQRQARAL